MNFPSKFLVACTLLILAGGFACGRSSCAADKAAKAPSHVASIMKPSADADFAEDVDADVDVDLSALIVPGRLMAKPPREHERLKFAQEMRAHLREGFQAKASAPDAAKKHFDNARRIVSEDPRPHYAYGLVLLSHHRSIVAIDEFRTAAKLNKLPFLPAWQMIVWTHVSRGEIDKALTTLLDLAHQLEESPASWPVAEDKEHSAEWLGKMLGFLDGPGKTAEHADSIDKLSAEVTNLLTGVRKEACERGRQQVAEQYHRLQAIASLPASELQAEAKRQREEIMATSPVAESEVEQLAEELRQLKRPHEKLLADLNREIHSNFEKIDNATAKLEAAEAAVAKHSEPKKHAQLKSQGMGRRQSTKVVGRDENAGEKKIREGELDSAQKSLDRLNSTINGARQGIAKARKDRESAQQEFREATVGQRQALRAARQKAAELTARAREAEHGKLTPETLKAQVKALESYLPLHFDLEQDRLLATLKPALRE